MTDEEADQIIQIGVANIRRVCSNLGEAAKSLVIIFMSIGPICPIKLHADMSKNSPDLLQNF